MTHHNPIARRRSIRRTTLVALMAGALTFATAAVAKAPTTVVKARTIAGKRLVVTTKGLTLYRLRPETTRSLRCTKLCTGVWPPLTVRSANTRLAAGPGVSGRLSLIRRPDGGAYQVALRGMPLYRFVGDSRPGTAAGNGIRSYGGTWLVVSAK